MNTNVEDLTHDIEFQFIAVESLIEQLLIAGHENLPSVADILDSMAVSGIWLHPLLSGGINVSSLAYMACIGNIDPEDMAERWIAESS